MKTVRNRNNTKKKKSWTHNIGQVAESETKRDNS